MPTSSKRHVWLEFLYGSERLQAVGCRAHAMPFLVQVQGQHFPAVVVVVGDQDPQRTFQAGGSSLFVGSGSTAAHADPPAT